MKYILIVDDDKDIAETLKMRLEVEDFDVEVVHDGEAALQKIAKREPDLVVMDVLMPKLDGLGTIKKVNQLRTKKVPFIIMTGTAVQMEEVFRMEGAIDFFKKPFQGAHLVERIKSVFG